MRSWQLLFLSLLRFSLSMGVLGGTLALLLLPDRLGRGYFRNFILILARGKYGGLDPSEYFLTVQEAGKVQDGYQNLPWRKSQPRECWRKAASVPLPGNIPLLLTAVRQLPVACSVCPDLFAWSCLEIFKHRALYDVC